MEWLLLLVVAGGGGLAAKRWLGRRKLRSEELAELEGIRQLADEDVTFLGEQLQRLDDEVKGHELDTATNPQHGPSVANVMWTQPGRGTRVVPACAQDAARIANHEVPEVRKVKIGSRTVPYWEAGVAYLPYAEGYFAGAAVMMWAFQPAADWGGGGHGGGFDGGGYDGGGYDGGGYDGGGGGDGSS